MKHTVILLFAFLTFTAIAEKNPTNDMLLKAEEALKKVNNNQDYTPIYKKLDVYSDTVKKGNWLLHYYSALARVFQASDNSLRELNIVPVLYADAELQLKKALKLEKNEEILILQAYIKILKMKSNVAEGYKLYGKEITSLLAEARSIAGTNPRLIVMEGLFAFYSPEELSVGKDRLRDIFSEAKDLYRNGEEMKYMFMPTWGASILEIYLNSLN